MWQALAEAGPSITLTTVTDIAAFILGSTIDLPGVADFCKATACCIFFVFFLQSTFFAGLMVFDQRRMDARRIDCCPCCCAAAIHGSAADGESQMGDKTLGDKTTGTAVGKPALQSPEADVTESAVRRFIRERYVSSPVHGGPYLAFPSLI